MVDSGIRKEILESLKNTNITFTGKLRSGKDYVADLFTDHYKLSLSSIMLEMFPEATYDKSTPGVRDFYKAFGQIGRGIVNETYPISIERMCFIDLVKRVGKEKFPYIHWDLFGKIPNFWSYALMNAKPVNSRIQEGPFLVTNSRFEEDLECFSKAGWKHYHVMCSRETRIERLKALGEKVDWPLNNDYRVEHLNVDISERYSTLLDNLITYPHIFEPGMVCPIPTSQVIWNDHRPPFKHSLLVERGDYIRVL